MNVLQRRREPWQVCSHYDTEAFQHLPPPWRRLGVRCGTRNLMWTDQIPSNYGGTAERGVIISWPQAQLVSYGQRHPARNGTQRD